jgi:subtilisin family serine protease
VPAGTLSFWVWVSSEYSDFDWLDYLSFSLDGEEQFRVDDPVLDVQLEIDGFPANHADVMAVGASTDLGYRSDYSQYGAKLDFVTLSSGGLLGIPSTDLTGLAGESSDDYLLDFGGTSASVPMAAGVAALVLAANPELRPTQLRTLLRLSAEKIGGVQYTSGFSPYYGYGRLNARKAIELAIPPRLVNPRLAGGVLSVSVASVSGYRYTLQYKGGVEAASWSSLPAVAGNDSVLTLTDPGAAGQPRRFYRVLASP